MSEARECGPERRLLSLLFYQAVRDQRPVWMLEDMRTMEAFHWERSAARRCYTPAEALLYAIVHDHRAYARHLLAGSPEAALAAPGERSCRCAAASASHLSTAVRYDRRDILTLILQAAHRRPGLRSYVNRGGCAHAEDGKTPLHLACELRRAEAVLLLLGGGASPQARDRDGMTPLDLVLERLRDSAADAGPERRCLEGLLMFISDEPRFKLRGALEREPQRWARVLGKDEVRYLTGRVPAPLFLLAMRSVLARLPRDRFPGSLDALPIPTALKPLPPACLGTA